MYLVQPAGDSTHAAKVADGRQHLLSCKAGQLCMQPNASNYVIKIASSSTCTSRLLAL
jgi:hypothetical protein